MKKRTCIVSPKYEPDKNLQTIKYEQEKPESKKPKKKSFKIEINIDFEGLAEKMKMFAAEKAEKCARWLLRMKPIYKKTVITALAAIVLIIMFCTFLSLGFDVYINDRFIGTVRGYEETDKVIDEVNLELEGKAVETISAKPSLYMRIVPQNAFTDDAALYEKVKLASGAVTTAAAVIWEGEPLFAVRGFSQVLSVIKEYGETFGGEAVGFSGDIKIEGTVCYENEISEKDAAIAILKEKAVPVITKETVLQNSVIKKSVNIKEDNTKREPYKIVEAEGQNGIAEQTVEITRVRGEETARKVISEKIIVEPQAQTVVVGTLPALTGRGSGTFILPAQGSLSSGFGARWGKTHKGLDIAADLGDNIVAADEGTVIFSGTQDSYGKIIIIDHQNGYTTRYAHCSKLYANTGELVGKGDLIAAVGNTGNSTGPHLHFEIRKNDTALDPLNFISIK